MQHVAVWKTYLISNVLRLVYRSANFFATKKLNCFTIIQKQKVFILELSVKN